MRGVRLDEDLANLAFGDHEQKGRDYAPVAHRKDGGLTVQVALARLEGSRALGYRGEERSDPRDPQERTGEVPDLTESNPLGAAVGDDDRVVRQELRQRLRVSAAGGDQERAEQAAVLVVHRRQRAPLGRDVLPRAAHELPAGGLGLVEQRRDLGVVVLEDLPQEEHGALRRSQFLEHDEERHRDAVDRLDRREPLLPQIDRLGEAIAPTLLEAGAAGVELIEAQACHHGDEERLGHLDRFGVRLPAQPRFLDDVLCASHVPEHPIGQRQQRGPMRLERRDGIGRIGWAHEDPSRACKRWTAAAWSSRGVRRRQRSRARAVADATTSPISGLSTCIVNGAGPSRTTPSRRAAVRTTATVTSTERPASTRSSETRQPTKMRARASGSPPKATRATVTPAFEPRMISWTAEERTGSNRPRTPSIEKRSVAATRLNQIGRRAMFRMSVSTFVPRDIKRLGPAAVEGRRSRGARAQRAARPPSPPRPRSSRATPRRRHT